jgi:membrane protein DedA with SNARE-associated domain
MNQTLKNILKLLSIPLILLGIYLLTMLIWKALSLPTDDQMVVMVKDYFAQYGLWIVFIGALIEGFLLLGQYFPGGLVIFLGVIAAGKDIPRVIAVVSVVSLAFFISYTLNYLVGKYGWYKLLEKFGLKQSIENSKRKLERHGLNAIIFSYWEPNLASITATAAGIIQVPLKKFLIFSAVGIVIWNIFWGTLVSSLGEAALDIMGLKYILIIFVIWVAVILIKKYIFERKSNPER